MGSFKDKCIVITGGATGIGFALAKAFGAEGAKIVIGEPRQEKLKAATAELAERGIEASSMVMDVSDPESMTTFANFAWATYGTVDGLINNAGVSQVAASVTTTPLEDLRRVFDVNVFGVWHGSAIFGERMEREGRPAFIYNVGSENSFFTAAPGIGAYVASKHAVRGLTEVMREELADFITVGLICPGFVRSDMTHGALGELAMDTDEFAGKVVEQIRAGEFYVVTHAYNIERIRPIHDEIDGAYAKYAPRYDGDDEYDVRTAIRKFMEARQK
ncbi:MAG: SDR family NAD(P)-dependent oxidoreductase [Pseudomonadota bacterium]